MKRIVFYLLTALTLSVAPTAQAAKGATPIEVPNDHKKAEARANVLLARLDEIKAMDKSSMTRAQRKELRKEVKEIRSELRTTNNGVYLSVGAIIIIILLLILLL
ncbi:MAG TPA: hypothetical protein PLA69_11295 [Flavobacterium sp.]|nr:hypothetical protein [Flavobacterium sp.]